MIQYVLDTCSKQDSAGVIMQPVGSVAKLSMQKFSSNVVEKCLERADDAARAAYINELANCDCLVSVLVHCRCYCYCYCYCHCFLLASIAFAATCAFHLLRRNCCKTSMGTT